MKNKTQLLQGAIRKQRLVSTLLVVFVFCFSALTIALYKNNLSTTANSSQSFSTIQSLRNFAAISTVSRTYTSKGTVIINNLWRPTQQITSGVKSSCALSDGRVFCWGDNSRGQLGNGNNTSSLVPVPVDTSGVLAGKSVTQIAAGNNHTCALANSQVYCWGGNSFSGELGNGTTTDSNVPVAVDTSGVLAGKIVTQISAGSFGTCAVANGQAYCWTRQFNIGTNVPVVFDNSGVLAGKTVTQLVVGGDHACTLANGQAYCRGRNVEGQLGNGNNTGSGVPVLVDTSDVLAGKTITQIAGFYFNTCVIADGQAFCWGYNTDGRLGNGNNTGSNVPVQVDISGVLAGKTVTQFSTGGGSFHVCAIANGQAYCWGSNSAGQLGNNTTTASNVPVAVDTSGVLAGKTVTSIAGEWQTSFLVANGRAYGTGYNNYGQLGNGTTNFTKVPGRVYDVYY